MEITRSAHTVIIWQDRLGRLLMGVAALGALTAVLGAIKTVQLASADTVWVQTWRLFGFAMFTGLFALLAWRPRKSACPNVRRRISRAPSRVGVSSRSIRGAREAAIRGLWPASALRPKRYSAAIAAGAARAPRSSRPGRAPVGWPSR